MERWFLLSLVSFCSIASANYGNGVRQDFCKNNFGESAFINFVPDNTNQFSVADSIFGKSTVVHSVGPSDPIGFRCQIPAKNKESCLKGMTFKKGMFSESICTSQVFSLKELCPSEVDCYVPRLKKATFGK